MKNETLDAYRRELRERRERIATAVLGRIVQIGSRFSEDIPGARDFLVREAVGWADLLIKELDK